MNKAIVFASITLDIVQEATDQIYDELNLNKTKITGKMSGKFGALYSIQRNNPGRQLLN